MFIYLFCRLFESSFIWWNIKQKKNKVLVKYTVILCFVSPAETQCYKIVKVLHSSSGQSSFKDIL